MFVEELEVRRMMSAANTALDTPAPGAVTPPNANAMVTFNAPPGPTGFSLTVITGNDQQLMVEPTGAPT